MSLADDDDEFARLVEGIEIAEPTDVVDVTTLNDKELLDRFADVRERLKDEGGMYSDLQSLGSRQGTAEERELHSLRLALLTELRKRGLA